MALGSDLLAAVVAALARSPAGMTRRDVHAAVDCWSRITIGHALRDLVAAGRIRFVAPPSGARRYFARES